MPPATTALFAALLLAQAPAAGPSALPAEAKALHTPRAMYRRGRSRQMLAPAEFEKLPADDKAKWQAVTIDEGTYQGLYYGSPLAYLLPLERLAEAGAKFGDLKGKKVADFGHGGVGQLRLFAALGAEAVGIDVDPAQVALYSAPGDQGPFGPAGGSVRLAHGRFPADPKVVEAVGGGLDLFLSKNTLKNGYVHPAEKPPPGQTIDLGADDRTFLKAVAAALKPGGWFVIYNLCPPPAPPGQPYRPMADGRCPFSGDDLAACGFETVVRDVADDKAARELGVAIGWDKPPVGMKLETDLFAVYTVLRKK